MCGILNENATVSVKLYIIHLIVFLKMQDQAKIHACDSFSSRCIGLSACSPNYTLVWLDRDLDRIT